MELYDKDLISREASLEKLVDDLMLVVEGADEFASAAGAGLGDHEREEIRSRLRQLKASCVRIKQQAVATALATDKVLRQYPYSAIGFAFAAGLLAGIALKRAKDV